jgi:hypothetical protein
MTLCWLLRISVQKSRTSKPLLNEEAEKDVGKDGVFSFFIEGKQEREREDKKMQES